VQRSVADQHRSHRSTAASSCASEHCADTGRSGLALRSCMSATSRIISSSKIEIGFGAGRDRDHNDVAAPILGQQAAIGQLLLNAPLAGHRPCRFC